MSAKNPRLGTQLLACRAEFVDPPRHQGAQPPPVRITLPDGTAVTSDVCDADATLSGFFWDATSTLQRAAPEGFTIDQYHPELLKTGTRGYRDTVTESKLGADLFAEVGIPSPVPVGSFFDLFPVSVLHDLDPGALAGTSTRRAASRTPVPHERLCGYPRGRRVCRERLDRLLAADRRHRPARRGDARPPVRHDHRRAGGPRHATPRSSRPSPGTTASTSGAASLYPCAGVYAVVAVDRHDRHGGPRRAELRRRPQAPPGGRPPAARAPPTARCAGSDRDAVVRLAAPGVRLTPDGLPVRPGDRRGRWPSPRRTARRSVARPARRAAPPGHGRTRWRCSPRPFGPGLVVRRPGRGA